jgi:hypothetical protein
MRITMQNNNNTNNATTAHLVLLLPPPPPLLLLLLLILVVQLFLRRLPPFLEEEEEQHPNKRTLHHHRKEPALETLCVHSGHGSSDCHSWCCCYVAALVVVVDVTMIGHTCRCYVAVKAMTKRLGIAVAILPIRSSACRTHTFSNHITLFHTELLRSTLQVTNVGPRRVLSHEYRANSRQQNSISKTFPFPTTTTGILVFATNECVDEGWLRRSFCDIRSTRKVTEGRVERQGER